MEDKITDPLKQNSDALKQDTAHLIYRFREKKNRRSGIDRRRFSYVSYIPDRRSGEERRGNPDIRETDTKPHPP